MWVCSLNRNLLFPFDQPPPPPPPLSLLFYCAPAAAAIARLGLTHSLTLLPCYLCSLSLLRLLLMLSALLMHFPPFLSFLSFTFLPFLSSFERIVARLSHYSAIFCRQLGFNGCGQSTLTLCVFSFLSPSLPVCVCHSRRIKGLATLLKCIAFSFSAWRGWLVGIGCD